MKFWLLIKNVEIVYCILDDKKNILHENIQLFHVFELMG